MADRTKTFLTSSPTASSATASETTGAPYTAGKSADRIFYQSDPWLTNNPPTLPAWIRHDYGSAKTFDTVLIADPTSTYRAIRNGGGEYSTDDAAWSSAYEFTDLFGGGAPANGTTAQLTFTAQTARYWRIRIDSHYGAAYFCGTCEVVFTTAIGSRLDNGGSFVLTSPEANTSSASEMSNRVMATYGFYFTGTAAGASRTFEIDLGSAQYIGGLDVIAYSLVNFWPTQLYLYTSTDGAPWTFAEVVTPPSWSNAVLAIPFSRIYSSRYFKFFPINASAGMLWMEWFIYATLTPAVPPDPTSVTARASDTGTDIELTWSEIAGDDNLLADLVYDITRQKDGGGYGSIATGVTGLYYVDTSLAAGDYDYKVQARNLYHARTSTAVQTGASITSPAAAAGGADPTAGNRLRHAVRA